MEYNKDDNKPILVQFENGPLKDEAKSTMTFKYMRSTLEKSNKRMLIADSGNLTYVGNILHNKQSLVKYYVGLVDKRTNTIEDIQGVQLCTLKSKLREEVSTNETPKTAKTYKQKSDNLVEAFGSAKQKRLVSSRKKNETLNESIGEKVGNIAKKILIESPKPADLEESFEGDQDMEQVIPPMNLDAKKVSDVFCIDDIISFQQYQLLKQHSKEMITFNHEILQTWKEENKYPVFILHHLSQLPTSTEARQEKGCYLCYLNYLITFLRISYKEVRKKDPCVDIPKELLPNILDRFTQHENGKNRCLPKKYKDKILCYILVLALIIEGYELNCNLLIKDLKLGVSRLSKLLRAMSCVVRTSTKRKADDESGPAERRIIAVLTISQAKVKSEDVTNVKKEPVVNETKDASIKQPVMKRIEDIKKENVPNVSEDVNKENLPKSIADIKKEVEE